MQTISLDITSRCPCACLGCFSSKSGEDMSLDGFKTIVKKLPKEELKSFVISGGEPALHKDLVPICKHVSRLLIKPTIFTSGVAKLKLKSLKPYVDNITFTIKYPFNEGDELWKRVEGSFDKATRQMERCNKLGIKVLINWAADRNNFVYMDEMSKLADEYNAKIGMLRFMPYTDFVREIALTDNEWEMLCQESLKYKNIKVMHPSKVSYSVCTGGVGRMHIKVNGEVTPCLYYSFDSVGNLLNNSYKEVEMGLERWRLTLGVMKMCPVQRRLQS